MTKTRLLAAVSGVVLLSGCAVFTGQNHVDSLNKASPSGSEFTRQLAMEYRDFANFEWDDMKDYEDGDYFARKGLQAAKGEMVLPEELSNWKIRNDVQGELAEGRTRLMAQLDAGARERASKEAAIAQARFDCWVEQEEEGWQTEDIAACRTQFRSALAALEGAMAPARAQQPAASTQEASYLVFFDFDRAEITAAAEDVLRTVVADVRQGKVEQVLVVGHTDTSGSEDYNDRLSQRRADAVRKALTSLGVPANQIMVEARGESQPLVATGDGVREPSNRRAEIRFR